MNMFSILSKRSPNKVFAGCVLGAASGIVYSLLIPLLNSALLVDENHYQLVKSVPVTFLGLEIANAPIAAIFILACLTIVLCRTISQVTLSNVAMSAASNLRTGLYDAVANAPVGALEKLGQARLTSTLTNDIPRIVAGAQALPEVLVSSVTLFGMLGFLLYLNASVFWFVLECIAFGAVTYKLPLYFGKRYFMRAGSSSDALLQAITGLVRGIKELKLNDAKRRAFFDTDLLANEQALLRAQQSGNTIMNIANNYGDMISFFSIGAIAFVFVNYHAVSSAELVGVTMALLYITGPISIILNMAPQISIAHVSLARVQALMAELPGEHFAPPLAPPAWEVLSLRQVTYQHRSTDDTPGFGIGPVDLAFRKGEITFIVGGNGSGKSTLCKLLTLHYPASSGSILFGTHEVDAQTINTFRQDISAIYSDYHLFDRIHGNDVDPAQVEHHLRALKLDKKVSYEHGRFSTLNLSDGQRRRLALVAAFIEDKEVYLFDEWAADQDPTFKHAFYHDILPSLKARGKVVIAITHDDRYFHVADRVVVMAEGKVQEVRVQTAEQAAQALETVDCL